MIEDNLKVGTSARGIGNYDKSCKDNIFKKV